MGEILGLGITHFPGLAPAAPGPRSLKRALQDPGMPEEYRTPAGWPDAMRAEWGDDEGASAGLRHRDAVVAEMRKARQVLDEFKPDLLVVWGDDQYENFREDIVPAFSVLAYDQVETHPWKHHAGTSNFIGNRNYWQEPEELGVLVKGHRQAAKFLARGLLAENFDVAYAYKPLHQDLGHAFLNSVLYLDWDRKGFEYPLIPFPINCYGRGLIALQGYMASMEHPPTGDDLDPPSPSPARCFDVGAACVRVLRDSPWRVALVASSSWSHAFLTPKHHYLYPDIPADRALYAAMQSGNYGEWRKRSLEAVEDSGQQELLNWFCLMGAMAELGRKVSYSKFIESWIMNSNK